MNRGMEVFWLEQRDENVPPGDGWLGAMERARMERFRFPKRRADWRLGRWTAKNAVALHLGLAADALARIEILAAACGAPEAFLDAAPAGVSISISHSSGLAACAVCASNVPLGCDVERVEARSEAFYADYFTTAEKIMTESAAWDDRARLATIVWSAKESVLKSLREGLRMDTRSVAVKCVQPAGAALWAHLAVVTETGQKFEGWWREEGGLVRTVVALPPPAPPLGLPAVISTTA